MTGTPSTTTKSGSLPELLGGPLHKGERCRRVGRTCYPGSEAASDPRCSRGAPRPRQGKGPGKAASPRRMPPSPWPLGVGGADALSSPTRASLLGRWT